MPLLKLHSMVGIIPECHEYLTKQANGVWYESYRFVNKDKYEHPVQRGMLLLRVETETKRAFYWLYKIQDAIAFNEFVGLVMKAECHEVIISSRCRMFYDIDLELDEFQQIEFANNYKHILSETNHGLVMTIVSKHVANVIKEATLLSLEEHGVEPVAIDWMWTMRNRETKDKYKISIHLVSNLILPLHACAAVASDLKRNIFMYNEAFLGINGEMVEALAKSIDETQYRRHGSLSLPFGTKRSASGAHTNSIVGTFNVPDQYYFITVPDQFSIDDLDMSGYNIGESSKYTTTTACPSFVKEAMTHIQNIKDYNPRVWDINASALKHSSMFVKRRAPSMCSMCRRTHDNDNTLFLIFNSEAGIASWRCARMPSMKPIIFYSNNGVVDAAEMDIEAFAATYAAKQPKASRSAKDSVCLESTACRLVEDDIDAFVATYKNRNPSLNVLDITDPFDCSSRIATKTFMRYGPPRRIIDDFRDTSGVEYDSEDTETQDRNAVGRAVKPIVAVQPIKVAEEQHEALEYYDDDDDSSVFSSMSVPVILSRVKVVAK